MSVDTAQARPPRAKVLIASLTGSTIEWFDFFLYGTAAALVFDELFFPSDDPFVSLMLSYLTFSLTFFIRPLGGVVFSHIGDRIGRKRTLIITLTLMGGATMLIGLLPTYDSVGILAPILLVVLRIIQGLGIGGEWGGALLLAYEYAPENRRGLFGSVPQMGITSGMLLASLVLTLMSLLPDDQFATWGWRVPFVGSVLLVLLGLWIRSGIDETPSFRKAKEEGEVAELPVVETFRFHWRAVLVAVGAKVVETAPFYIFGTFVVSYATGTLSFDNTSALNAVTVGAIVATVCIPIAGRLSDTFGRQRVYLVGAVLLALFIAPYFLMLGTGSTLMLVLATVIGLGVLWAPVTATIGTLCSEIFSTRVRYTGVTLGYQIGAAAAGGTAPLIATWLLSRFDNSWVPVAGYLVLTAVVSIVAVALAGRASNAEERHLAASEKG
ncbi:MULTISPECIES: MFS transporter [Nocardiopsis]|uniref:Putative proline/betaine transporter n=1 Tax=Nocardiopsis dassonvillei (strain ATCC 23218 / DSM 43111 / CIP 107115 / JCM 7437 / KCTC 9190 / NBRC 14626 / NCTC 10488 / NRRL B-5397 / IMRU 509) TaxID=446468 RepID=D7AY19_NOCDD|nr:MULTISPECIES: MFS transporter [Nocardiopsis]ADH69897.1 General substrate transporter [Nocardiopsis dassonvillei subsp. dassonvillei DSM 43111]APC37883.1 MFS transporter [Nocardiopsis dassonvillei]NKY77446.1 MHS family MFS transporter [Nocardiopsis dassonvillei]VEI90410.1 Inner membrane metabolite transport protein yhjE [Nocardiopsis dassonvillei]